MNSLGLEVQFMPQSHLFFTAKTMANRPILVETLLPSSQKSLLCDSLFCADAAPLTTKGIHQSSMRMSQPQGASHISMSLEQLSTSPPASWALYWAISIPVSLHIFLCTTVWEEKIQPDVAISYSDFTPPSDLPLLFLAAWQTLSRCVPVSCLTIPASPTSSRGRGGCMLGGG